jgi:aryl-alcohol dehydrogenase-like predicted oxidoreductase/enamine deaminase RidA (YjgF/YER057c/UK114 family)
MNKPGTTKLSESLEVSQLIGGLWQIADMEREGSRVNINLAVEAMDAYVKNGITSFDMADHYGSAELIAGAYGENYGTPAQFLTKWVPAPGGCTRSEVRDAVTLALSRMKTNRLDLLQYHAWNYADPSWIDQLFWLQELKTEGLINNLGVTNFDAAHLRIALTSGIELVSNQVCYSLLDQRASGELAQVCKEFKVRVLAFGVLAGGFLSDRWLDKKEPETLATWSQMKYKRFIDTCGGWDKYQRVMQILKKVADRHDCSIANIATKYVLDQEHVGAVIIGIRLGENQHIEDNLRALQLELSSEDQFSIQNAISSLSSIPGGCGDEYRKPPYLTASGDLSHHIDDMPPPYAVTEHGKKTKVRSGTVWETMAGFSRAVMVNQRISISGTTATHGEKAIGGDDPVAQTHFIIDKIEGAMQSLGASLEDVVRTRVYVSNLDHWEAVAKVHGKRFGDIHPANTMVRADLVGDYLVEIEAEAEISDTNS